LVFFLELYLLQHSDQYVKIFQNTVQVAELLGLLLLHYLGKACQEEVAELACLRDGCKVLKGIQDLNLSRHDCFLLLWCFILHFGVILYLVVGIKRNQSTNVVHSNILESFPCLSDFVIHI